jgi:prophage regulatory protein
MSYSPQPEDSSFLDIKQVMKATSLSRSSIYRGVKAGTFPAPVAVTTGRVAWRAADVAIWIDAPLEWGAEAEF